MATLKEIRSSIIAQATALRPTTDFPATNRILDYWIMDVASALLKKVVEGKKGTLQVEPWMVSEFECLAAEEKTSDCPVSCPCVDTWYSITLPFEPLMLQDNVALQGVFSCGSVRERYNYVAPGRTPTVHLMPYPPSQQWPYYTLLGNKIYLIAPGRDPVADECKFSVFAVPGRFIAQPGDTCATADNSQVPVPSYMRPDLEQAVLAKLLNTLGQAADTTDDGNAERTVDDGR